ncbi:MAG: RES domain-containing protein [Colwellia sp.]|nr:RES domain-containing protein [Colwellia sp.]
MKFICEDCINNEVLKQHLIKKELINECSYCESKLVRIISSEELIKFGGDRLVNSLYSIDEATSYEAAMFFESCDKISFKEIAYIIEDLEVGDSNFEDELAEYIWVNSSSDTDLFVLDYGDHDNNSYKIEWSKFIKSIAHKHRFFNKDAKVFLDSLFEVLLNKGEVRDRVITTINSTTELFRARVANDESTRKEIVSDPATQLGPVPEWLAGEQRMTPTGISALYCSLERDTCFSEVRAITGDVVLSGIFKPTEELHLLDLTKIHKLSQLTIDPFDNCFSDFSNRSEFIRDLMFLMSRPASKNNSSNYLSTQIIFEYLSVKFGNKLSGLMFNSVQTDGKGKNVVLFPEKSTVNSSPNCFKNIKSISEHHTGFGDFQYYFYSIEKSPDKYNLSSSSKAKLDFVDGSLMVSKVKAVVTKTEDIPIEISVT